MSSRKRRRHHPTAPTRPRQLEELDAANELIAAGRWAEARALLEPLVARQPGREDLLGALMDVCEHLRDARGYLEVRPTTGHFEVGSAE